jgi:hypothetical protein
VIDKNYISFDYFIVQPFVENLIEVLLQKHIVFCRCLTELVSSTTASTMSEVSV